MKHSRLVLSFPIIVLYNHVYYHLIFHMQLFVHDAPLPGKHQVADSLSAPRESHPCMVLMQPPSLPATLLTHGLWLDGSIIMFCANHRLVESYSTVRGSLTAAPCADIVPDACMFDFQGTVRVILSPHYSPWKTSRWIPYYSDFSKIFLRVTKILSRRLITVRCETPIHRAHSLVDIPLKNKAHISCWSSFDNVPMV